MTTRNFNVKNGLTVGNVIIDATTGNLTGLGNANLGNLAIANFFSGDGGLLANINGANISGNISGNISNANYASYAGQVIDATQSNITAVGNLTSLTVVGNIAANGLLTNNLYYANGTPWDFQLPGGSNTQVQFNDNGDFGGSANFTFDKSTNILTVNGNISGGNLVTGGVVSATGNVSGGNLTTTGVVSATGNVSGGNITTAGVVSATGNVSGGNLTTTGALSVTGNANVGNIGAADGVFTANVSANNLSTTNKIIAGNGLQVTTGAIDVLSGNLNITGNLNVTGNVNYANVTDLVVGDPLIYIGANNTGDTYDLGIVASYNDGTYVHTGIARNAADNYWTFFDGVVAEPTTVIDWANATYPTVKMGNLITTGTANISGNANVGNLGTGGLITATGNITGGNLVTGGLIQANGNITGANIIATNAFIGNISVSGDINVNSLTSNTTVSATGNVSGGNLTTTGVVSATGNVSGGNITTAGVVSATGNVSGGNITTIGVVSATGNVSGGNLTTIGEVSATGNITGGNLVTTGLANIGSLTVSGTSNLGPVGNVTITGGSAGQYLQTNGSGVLTWATANTTQIFNGTSNVSIPTADGNVNTSVNGNANVFVVTGTGANVSGTFNASGNANVGNLGTSGLIVATGNITGGNLVTGGQVSATGNITAGNVYANTGTIGANLLTGTLTTNAQPNITSVGTLTSLDVTGNATAGNVAVSGGFTTARSNVSVSTGTVIDQFNPATYRTAKYVVSASGDNGYQSVEALLVHDGSNAYITIYGSVCSNVSADIIELSSNVNGVSGNVAVYATAGGSNVKVNLVSSYINT